MLSVGFDPGQRPRASDIVALASHESSFRVSHQPPEVEGWVELLVNGLTFDLTGLAPGPSAEAPRVRDRLGAEQVVTLEAIALAPGPHIAAGRNLPPIIRAAAGLAVSLCRLDHAKLVFWHAAGNAVSPNPFARVVGDWLAGGPFPGLGLTSLYTAADGSMCSVGLQVFTGQELRLEAISESPAETAKTALRLIDRLVQHGPLVEPVTWDLDGRRRVRLEAGKGGETVRAWRERA